VIRLRPAGAADVAAVTDFLAGLEPSAAWLRFGVGLGVPSRAFVHRLVSRGEDRGSWVADVDGGVVAHASWTRLPDGVSAELGIVVAEHWRRSGLGRLLGRAVGDEACAAGAERLRFEVLPANLPARSLVTHLWPTTEGRLVDGMVVYDVPLRRHAHVC